MVKAKKQGRTCSSITPKNEVEGRMINQTIADIESLFIASQVASCENLIALFEPRFAAAPEDLDLAKNVVKIMSITEGCTDNDLYLNSVNTMYRLEPSANSAYYLYRLYSGRNDYDNAVKYLEEAIASEETDAVPHRHRYTDLIPPRYHCGYICKCRRRK